MIFNPDTSKQAQEVVFSRKTEKANRMSLTFNVKPVAQTSHQKHLGLYIDEKLNFSNHIKEIISKVNKGIGIIRKLRYILPRNALLTIYKAFTSFYQVFVILSMNNLIMKVSVIILRNFNIMLLLL